jgi:hypothetical protein
MNQVLIDTTKIDIVEVKYNKMKVYGRGKPFEIDVLNGEGGGIAIAIKKERSSNIIGL